MEVFRRNQSRGAASGGWGRLAPTLVPWRQGFRLQQETSVGAGLPKPASVEGRTPDPDVKIVHGDTSCLR
jgi:hypothetical protein